jgi:HSP20 family molecular chaperone IbpA
MMKCPKCGKHVEDGWKFCSECGYMLRRKSLFGSIFERMNREMREMDKRFERNFEVLDASSLMRKPVRSRGFSIKISSGTGREPKVSVKTFGDVRKEDIRPQVQKLGIQETPDGGDKTSVKKLRIGNVETTEEPATSIRNVNGRIVAEIKLPGVKNIEDIEIETRENSIEVKAVSGNNAYFKILTKPNDANIVGKELRKGVLSIELA